MVRSNASADDGQLRHCEQYVRAIGGARPVRREWHPRVECRVDQHLSGDHRALRAEKEKDRSETGTAAAAAEAQKASQVTAWILVKGGQGAGHDPAKVPDTKIVKEPERFPSAAEFKTSLEGLQETLKNLRSV